jgi:hypothetical protein
MRPPNCLAGAFSAAAAMRLAGRHVRAQQTAGDQVGVRHLHILCCDTLGTRPRLFTVPRARLPVDRVAAAALKASAKTSTSTSYIYNKNIT